MSSTAQTSRPWRIHEVARGFDLIDVWALPTPGGAGDFPRLVELFSSFDPAQSQSAAVLVYPAIMRELEQRWVAEVDAPTP